MKTAKELYPEEWENEQKNGYFYIGGSYQPILEEIGEIIIQIDDKDWQGDSRLMYKKDDKYGYLIFGWGSCSGCDALQACRKINEIQSLINSLVEGVKWFDSLEELKKHFSERDWELQYSWHQKETKDFVEQVLNYINK